MHHQKTLPSGDIKLSCHGLARPELRNSRLRRHDSNGSESLDNIGHTLGQQLLSMYQMIRIFTAIRWVNGIPDPYSEQNKELGMDIIGTAY